MKLPAVAPRLIACLSLIVIEYACALAGLSLRGAALDRITGPIETLLWLVVVFCCLQMLGTQLTNLRSYLRSRHSLGDQEFFWQHYLPRRVRNSEKTRVEFYYQLLTSHLPRLVYFRLELPIQLTQAALAVTAFVAFALYFGLPAMLLAIPLIFGSAEASRRYFAKDFKDATQRIARDKEYAARWLKAYFGGNKEIELNWRKAPDYDERSGFHRAAPQRLLGGLKLHLDVTVRRQFLLSMLEEYPYFLAVSTAIIAGAYSGLSIGEIYVISSMVTYLSSAQSALQRYRSLRIEREALEQLVQSSLIAPPPQPVRIEASAEPSAAIALLDGTVTAVGAEPKIYRISGGNGSGKTTLVDAVCGFSDHYGTNAAVASLEQRFDGRAMVISDDPVIFDSMMTFAQCVSGHVEDGGEIERRRVYARLEANLRHLLGPELTDFWRARAADVERKWESYRELSRGERVLLSCLRLFYHWQPSTGLIVMDECDYFLQAAWKPDFAATVRALARNHSVYLISHDPAFARAAEPQYCDEERSHA